MKKNEVLRSVLIFLVIIGSWIVITGWVLPYFGINTCMSGVCAEPIGTLLK